MIQQALAELLKWRVKYRNLNELALVFRSHDEVLADLDG